MFAGLAAMIALQALHPPPGMVAVEGGPHWRGRDDAHRPDERPRHQVIVSPFFIDETLVTVAAFAAFVDATHHRTDAERFGWGYAAVEGMRDWQWVKAKGASWRRPFGDLLPSFVVAQDHPATQVSWRDADAYCRWMKKRLPTEVEWEVAMSAGAQTRYPWGPTAKVDGVARLNHWQGRAVGDEHEVAVVDDGHLYLSPVKAYPPNALGIYDPVGNVWQITDTWYDKNTFADEARAGVVADPTGPRHGTQKVARGGSWWCSARTCQGFGLWYRGKNDVDAPFNNVGFRCAVDALSTKEMHR